MRSKWPLLFVLMHIAGSSDAATAQTLDQQRCPAADPRGRLRARPGCQPLGPPGTHQVRPLPSTAGPASIYSEDGWIASATRPSNFRGQVCQRAIVMVLELVYEQDFLPCSYGFRPGRSAHQALQDLRSGHPASQTSSCIMCWTSGLRTR